MTVVDSKNRMPSNVIADEQPIGSCLDDRGAKYHPFNKLPDPAARGDVILFSENRDQYKKTVASFKEAESFLKIAEFQSTKKELDIPSINELRYYGYHLNKAYEAKDKDEQSEELKRAERHCKRASYDALELAVVDYLKTIQAFHIFYSNAVVTDVIREYPALLAEVEAIKEFIGIQSHEDRTEHYLECATKLKRLKEISIQFECSRSSLNSKISEGRRLKKIQVITIIIATIAATLTGVKIYTGNSPSASIVTAETLSTKELKPTADTTPRQ